jgi:hypothetical protein
MSAEFVMRSVAIMACATTLSLFTTIAAYAAVGVVAVKNDQAAPAFAARTPAAKPVQVAKIAARAS